MTAIQTRSIPRILEGANVVIASPTASGKTEAVVAPVAERFRREHWTNLAIVYVVPTRALANDLLERVEAPLRQMNIVAVLKHGDSPHLPSKPINFLITTPESLDSLICRHEEIFSNLRTVIIDEVHLLDNTYRGDQLRVLLCRLRRICDPAGLNVHMMSATLGDPDGLARRYVDEFDLLVAHGQRELEYEFAANLQDLLTIIRQHKWKKILYFCNRRASVETVAAELRSAMKPYPVVAHHGSLSRDVREETERVMKTASVALCVATSTLEIGIDIGSIDAVVLGEPPWSVSALQQRIGRGNRRSRKIKVVAIAASDDEKALLNEMFQAAISGDLPSKEYQPDLSVVVQQIFSMLYQRREGISESELQEVLTLLGDPSDITMILSHLQSEEWIEFRRSRWFMKTKLADLAEIGKIHSNVPSSQSYRVVNVNSGIEVGQISGVFDRVFLLAHRPWEIVSHTQNTIGVKPYGGHAISAIFQPSRNVGEFLFYLPPHLMAKARRSSM